MGTIVINKDSITIGIVMLMGLLWFYLVVDYVRGGDEE
tara:strand:+ start:134 stop:247 length:114 start_codon:yes stop_codon:yes gene_type:complete